ncbi:MAG: hypothetical protein ACKOW1_00095 [Novosphingobium sp.]
MTMFGLSQLPARFTAAVSAFALSLVLIGATVSMPSQAQARTTAQAPVQTAAYVGVVA